MRITVSFFSRMQFSMGMLLSVKSNTKYMEEPMAGLLERQRDRKHSAQKPRDLDPNPFSTAAGERAVSGEDSVSAEELCSGLAPGSLTFKLSRNQENRNR